MNEQLKRCRETTIDRYMALVPDYDVEGLAGLFPEEAKVFSPLLGWMEPRAFFQKMKDVSGSGKTTLYLPLGVG